MPDATGVLLDRPEALAVAPDYLTAAGVADRVELVRETSWTTFPPATCM